MPQYCPNSAPQTRHHAGANAATLPVVPGILPGKMHRLPRNMPQFCPDCAPPAPARAPIMPRMLRHLAALCLILAAAFAASACGHLRPPQIEEEREISTQRVPFIQPQSYHEREAVLTDTLKFAFGPLDLTLIHLSDSQPSDTTAKPSRRIRIEALQRPDTLWAEVPRESRVVTRTVVQKEMPWWGWVLITALGMVLMLALVRR